MLDPSPKLRTIYFNLSSEAFGSAGASRALRERTRCLRLALRQGFDAATFNQRYYSGLLHVRSACGASGLYGDAEPLKLEDHHWFSLSRAVATLRQAGWNADNLPVLRIVTPPGMANKQMAQFIKASFIRLGYPQTKG